MEYLPYLTVAQQNLLLKPILRKRHYRGENINLPPSPPPELSPLAKRLISPIPFECEITAGLFPRESTEQQVNQPADRPDTPSEASSFVYVQSDSDTDDDWDKDEAFQQSQPGPIVEDDGDFTDTDSEISNDSDYDPTHESLSERISALRDIIPPTTRSWFWNKWLTTQRVVKGVVFFAGRSMWSISVSALLIGVPFALCWAEEQQVIAMEQEVRMREMGADVLTAGAGGEANTADVINQALGKEGGVQTKAAGL
ncbi:Mitochondrial import receptor subunit tom22 [Cytospora mali]|uniref:Mitochondrial import receptor subunit tom22 n=1 Tax=Cytospora mali TaxID=578113 RepID=A0A194VFK2_CYTMA|nr:Mitochondrial import receptor subunit tom22 [Valsa mali var. pyri (nom. inval.)]